MTSEQSLSVPVLIVQLPRGGAVDRYFQANPSPSVASGQVVLEHLPPEDDGRLGLPDAGEIVLSVLSPEALRRDPEEVQDAIRDAPAGHEPLVVVVEAAEELREDELAVVLNAAANAPGPVILRVLADG
jgi:hypothetical protein